MDSLKKYGKIANYMLTNDIKFIQFGQYKISVTPDLYYGYEQFTYVHDDYDGPECNAIGQCNSIEECIEELIYKEKLAYKKIKKE